MLSADSDKFLTNLKFSSKVTVSAILYVTCWYIKGLDLHWAWRSCGAMFRSTKIKLSS